MVLDLPVPRGIVICIYILIGFVTNVTDIARFVFRQETRVMIDAEEICATLNQQFLIGREYRQTRLIETLLGALVRNLIGERIAFINWPPIIIPIKIYFKFHNGWLITSPEYWVCEPPALGHIYYTQQYNNICNI